MGTLYHRQFWKILSGVSIKIKNPNPRGPGTQARNSTLIMTSGMMVPDVINHAGVE